MFAPRALADLLFVSLGISREARFAVGFSGGADSTALLLAMRELRPSADPDCLLALHFNHHIHADSDHWQARCEAFCQSLGIGIRCGSWDRDPAEPASEALARAMRFAWFGEVLETDRVLLLAHHRDDQVETILMNLLEGRNLARVAGMRIARALEFGDPRQVVRPLLGFSRASLRQYVRQQGRSWIEDPANQDTRHTRVFLRQEILPTLRSRWPDIESRVVDFGRSLDSRLREERARCRDLLDDLLRPGARRLFCLCAPVSLMGFMALPADDRKQILRLWLHDAGLRAPSDRAIEDALRQIGRWGRSDGVGATIRIGFNGVSVRSYRQHLFLLGELPEAGDAIAWQGESNLLLPAGLQLIAGEAYQDVTAVVGEDPVYWQWREGGERLRLPGRGHRTTLKKVFQDRGIPEWERDALPHLASGDEILWVHGIGWCGELADRIASRQAAGNQAPSEPRFDYCRP